jgi:hypothetical protein
VRPAADRRCFIHLVDHLIQPTRFRRKVVLLKVNQVLKDHQKALEDIFRAAGDPQAAALQAERFIRQRLERNLPEMTADEKREADQRSTAVIALLEQEFLGGEGDETETLDDLEEDEGAVRLTEEERRTGAQMGRVEMRVAGGWRLVPQKLMPDPDDPERFVIAVRDPASGDLVPQLRRGVKRFVEKTRDGSWRLDA